MDVIWLRQRLVGGGAAGKVPKTIRWVAAVVPIVVQPPSPK